MRSKNCENMQNIENIEKIEFCDWDIKIDDDAQTRRKKSIEAYYLPKWYDKIREYTFETSIYPIITTLDDACPNVLPYENCMIRYENKSPKDSEFWGPLKTKEEVLNVFNTSLRCITTSIKKPKYEYLVIRKWDFNIQHEYRCFWNHGTIVAIGSQNENTPHNELLKYIDTIKNHVPYIRCVMDICQLKNNDFKIVEFNSWETNSGADPFCWINDTELLYPDLTKENYVKIKTQHSMMELSHTNPFKFVSVPKIDFDKIRVCKEQNTNNCIVTSTNIYITTDIWLCMFDLNLKPINWKRGNYRFSDLQLCSNGYLHIDNKFITNHLQTVQQKFVIVVNKNKIIDNRYKYGVWCYYDKTGYDKNERVFLHLLNNGDFIIGTN